MNLLPGLTLTAGVLGLYLAATTLNSSADGDGPVTNRKDRKVVTGQKRTPVIVELFTSEGCSSCPSADAALAKLVREQPFDNAEIIPLSQHVDYWNHIGWTDPYSSHQYSQRQSDYSEAFKLNSVYTPQAVVDGRAEFVGSDRQSAASAIKAAASQEKATVKLQVTGKSLDVKLSNIPSITVGDRADVMLAITEDGLLSNVKRGENAGRKLPHVAVVRSLRTIGSVTSTGLETRASLSLDAGWNQSQLSAVVFLQEHKSRRILGAGRIEVGN